MLILYARRNLRKHLYVGNSFVNRILLDVGPLTEYTFVRSIFTLFYLPFAKWVLESFANMNVIMLLQENDKSDGQPPAVTSSIVFVLMLRNWHV